MLVTGSNGRDEERETNSLELSHEYTIDDDQSSLCHAPKKSLSCHKQKVPVPETDTGGWVEYTKGRERTLSKELGKIAP
jgi:hypothetical protein